MKLISLIPDRTVDYGCFDQSLWHLRDQVLGILDGKFRKGTKIILNNILTFRMVGKSGGFVDVLNPSGKAIIKKGSSKDVGGLIPAGALLTGVLAKTDVKEPFIRPVEILFPLKSFLKAKQSTIASTIPYWGITTFLSNYDTIDTPKSTESRAETLCYAAAKLTNLRDLLDAGGRYNADRSSLMNKVKDNYGPSGLYLVERLSLGRDFGSLRDIYHKIVNRDDWAKVVSTSNFISPMFSREGLMKVDGLDQIEKMLKRCFPSHSRD